MRDKAVEIVDYMSKNQDKLRGQLITDITEIMERKPAGYVEGSDYEGNCPDATAVLIKAQSFARAEFEAGGGKPIFSSYKLEGNEHLTLMRAMPGWDGETLPMKDYWGKLNLVCFQDHINILRMKAERGE